MENSFALRRTIASQEEVRIRIAEKAGARRRSFRGIRTIYHDEFPPYFNWVVAKIPLVQRHDTFDLHLNCYGIPLKLYELDAYLEELLGNKFEALFSFAAGRAEYQYLDDVLAMGLDKLGAEAEDAGVDWLNLGRARAWLAEQIAPLKTAGTTLRTEATELGDEEQSAPRSDAAPYSPWTILLGQKFSIDDFSVDDFYKFLKECRLLTPDGELTPLGKGENLGKARAAPWVGTLQALLATGILFNNAAAICRALNDPDGKIGIVLSENTLRYPSDIATLYQEPATSIIGRLGLLRN